MHFPAAILQFLALSGAASSRPVRTEESVVVSVGILDHASSTVSNMGPQASDILDGDAGSSIVEFSTSAPTLTRPRDHGAQPTISLSSQQSQVQTEPSESPSLERCMFLYDRLRQHDPRLFDLAKCPVDGRSVMRDAILRCQVEHPLASEEDRMDLEKQVQEFFEAMRDDCEKGRRLLKDHHPLRKALYSLGGLIAIGGVAYACKCRKCLRKQFDKFVKRHTSMPAELHLPSYHDNNSDEGTSENDPYSSDDESLSDQPV